MIGKYSLHFRKRVITLNKLEKHPEDRFVLAPSSSTFLNYLIFRRRSNTCCSRSSDANFQMNLLTEISKAHLNHYNNITTLDSSSKHNYPLNC